MIVNAVIAISSGSQAPCGELGEVGGDEQQVDREQRDGAGERSATSGCSTGSARRRRTAAVVIVIVPVTAMPNAYASAAELRNAKISVSTETSSSQLIHGT